MDSEEIATGILSLTAPSVARWPKLKRRSMARRVNEFTAGLVEKRPDRFGNFATLTLHWRNWPTRSIRCTPMA